MENKSSAIDSGIKEPLFIVKIGGNIIDDPAKLSTFLQELASVKSKKILIHGGGKIASQIGEKLGLESNYNSGRRITDDDTLDLVTMVYGGLINKKIVATLQSQKCNAIGVTGADANLIPAKKRVVKEIDFGWAGDIEAGAIESGNWQLFLHNNLVPVVAPLTHDGTGNILNTNADTIASNVAISLSELYEVVLIYCFEKNGVLENISDDHSVIAFIDQVKYELLLSEKKIAEGMLPKIHNALSAIDAGVKKIVIGNAEDLIEIVQGKNKGTTFIK